MWQKSGTRKIAYLCIYFDLKLKIWAKCGLRMQK